MMPPVRCFTCGKPTSALQEEFDQDALTDTLVYGLVLKNQQDNITLDLK